MRFEVLAAWTAMKALFLGVEALETTAAIFSVGVYQTGRQHIAEFFQPICATTVPYFILYFVLRCLKDLLECLKHCSYPGIFLAVNILEELKCSLLGMLVLAVNNDLEQSAHRGGCEDITCLFMKSDVSLLCAQ